MYNGTVVATFFSVIAKQCRRQFSTPPLGGVTGSGSEQGFLSELQQVLKSEYARPTRQWTRLSYIIEGKFSWLTGLQLFCPCSQCEYRPAFYAVLFISHSEVDSNSMHGFNDVFESTLLCSDHIRNKGHIFRTVLSKISYTSTYLSIYVIQNILYYILVTF